MNLVVEVLGAGNGSIPARYPRKRQTDTVANEDSKNSPVRHRADPYTGSAVQHPKSVLRVDRMPRRTSVRWSTQLPGIDWAMRDAFS